MTQIIIVKDEETLIQETVDRFIRLSRESIHKRGLFSAALSGGSTPKPVYHALGAPENQKKLQWDSIHLFWGDERHVPPDHAESNYRMVKEQLLEVTSIPETNIHRVPAEMEVRMAAFSYEETLRRFFPDPWPRFDLILLGMGRDGHTASLFPHSAGLNEEHRWFIANFAPEQGVWRLTLSKNAINAARNILVLVQGEGKAGVLKELFDEVKEPEEQPIRLISPVDGKMVWLLDENAAQKLSDDKL